MNVKQDNRLEKRRTNYTFLNLQSSTQYEVVLQSLIILEKGEIIRSEEISKPAATKEANKPKVENNTGK